MTSIGEGIRKDINRGAIVTSAGNAFKVAEFLFTLLAARLFGVEAWGRYIFLSAFLYPVMRFACAGLDKGVLWYVARHRDRRIPGALFARVRNRMLLFSVLVLSAFAAWRFLLRPAPSDGALLDPEALVLMALATPFLILTNIYLGVSIAFRKIEHEIGVRSILYPLAHLGLPCLLAFWSRDLTVLAACFLAGSAAGYLLSRRLAAPFLQALERNPEAEGPDPFVVLWAYSWPMGVKDVFLSLHSRVDVWCLGLFLSPAALGVYGLALTIAASIKTVRQSFDNILLSVFSNLRRGADAEHIRAAFLHAGQAITAFQAPVLAFLVFFAAPMLALSGPEYAAGETPLLIFALTLTLTGYVGLSSGVVMGLGKSRWAMWNDAAALATAVLFNLLLVPRFGIAGAACGTSLSILLSNLVWYTEAVYLIRRVPLDWSIPLNFLLGFALIGAAYALWRAFGDAGLPSRALWFGLFAAAYGTLLYAFFWKRIFPPRSRA